MSPRAIGKRAHRERCCHSDARWAATGHLVYAHTSGALWAVPFDEPQATVTGPAMSGFSIWTGAPIPGPQRARAGNTIRRMAHASCTARMTTSTCVWWTFPRRRQPAVRAHLAEHAGRDVGLGL